MRRPKEGPPLRVTVHYMNAPDWEERYLRALAVVAPELLGADEAPQQRPAEEREAVES